ncbi:MAG: N-acetyl-alpha-D-glucosaminyl L-malate synthase BshA [Phycisphaerales bacterium]
MKIAITCHPTQGGSGVVATELAMALAQRGHEVHVVAYERPFRLHELPGVTFHRVNVSDYPLFRYPPHDLCLANKLAEVAVEHDLDIIHAHYAVPHAVSAMLARDMLCVCERKVKVVATVHGTDITLTGSHKDFYRVCRYAMMRCDGLTAVSGWLRDKTMAAFDLPTPPEVIPNFVDCDRFTSRGRVGWPVDGKFRILHASNFRPVKRVFDIVRVFQKIRERLHGAELVMVGDGPERGGAQELAGELGICGAVRFVGAQVDIEQMYREAHLFLLLSDYESFGLSALEAMACGTPVVASKAGGLVEVVEDGVTGRLCRVGDVEAMAKAGVEILSDSVKWNGYSMEGKVRSRRNFCKDLIVPQYEMFYEQVMKGEGVLRATR